MLYEKEGPAWPSEVWEWQIGINAPDWTRTSTPLRAQALNLPRIPIPPQGLRLLLYSLPGHLSTHQAEGVAKRKEHLTGLVRQKRMEAKQVDERACSFLCLAHCLPAIRPGGATEYRASNYIPVATP